MSAEPIRHADTIIFPASLDPDAVSVVERLTQSDFESYLVGGCVRDLLCGMIPKDFDVSTAARPRQIRSRFRNCRVIGRRFKLAHVHFGDKIIEVATFRRTPDSERDDAADGEDGPEGPEAEDLLITRDNVYGTAEQDVLRRDFTINALLYDVGPAEVIDYVGGVKDLNDRVLRTIGDPAVRLAEDPIRMLRAVRFHSRLGLTIAPDLDEAMRASASLISKSAPPRVLEEIYRVMTCGKASQALPALVEYGLMQHLLPGLSEYWSDHRDQLEAYGAALDVIDHGARRVSNAFLLALLFLEPWKAAQGEGEGGDGDLMSEARDLITPLAQHMSVPRKDVGIAKQLLMLQLRLERNRRSRRVRMGEFIARPLTQEAIALLYAGALAGRVDPSIHAIWARRVATLEPDEPAPQDEQRPARKRKRRRRRSRSRRGQAERESTAATGSDSETAEATSGGRERPKGRAPRGRTSPARAPATGTGSPSAPETAGDADTPASAATGAGPQSRPQSRPTAESPKAPETPPKPKGIRGWIRAIFGGPRASEAASAPPGGAPAPRSPAEADGSQPPSPAASEPLRTEADQGAASRTQDRSEAPGSRRRRRRGSGRSGSGRSESGRSRRGRGAEEAGASAESTGGAGRRKRGRRKGNGSSSASGSSGRSGGGRKKAGKRSGGQQDRAKASPKKKSGEGESKPAPAHERPEEIEDLFDW